MDVASAPDSSGHVFGASNTARDQPDVGLLDRLELDLEDAAHALRRLDEGTYADCEVCGQPVGDERLAASPVTRRCAEHEPVVSAGPSTAEPRIED